VLPVGKPWLGGRTTPTPALKVAKA
jgi:hypothetical protein